MRFVKFTSLAILATMSACTSVSKATEGWTDTASYNIGKWADGTSSWAQRNYASFIGEELAEPEEQYTQQTAVPAPKLEVQDLAPLMPLAPIDAMQPSAEYGIAQAVPELISPEPQPQLNMQPEFYYDKTERGHSFAK